MRRKTVGRGLDRVTVGKLGHPAVLECGTCNEPIFVGTDDERYLTPHQAHDLGKALIQMAGEIKPSLRDERDELLDAAEDALIWCSGSYDFGPEGQAREGWLKLCKPLIDKLSALRNKVRSHSPEAW